MVRCGAAVWAGTRCSAPHPCPAALLAASPPACDDCTGLAMIAAVSWARAASRTAGERAREGVEGGGDIRSAASPFSTSKYSPDQPAHGTPRERACLLPLTSRLSHGVYHVSPGLIAWGVSWGRRAAMPATCPFGRHITCLACHAGTRRGKRERRKRELAFPGPGGNGPESRRPRTRNDDNTTIKTVHTRHKTHVQGTPWHSHILLRWPSPARPAESEHA